MTMNILHDKLEPALQECLLHQRRLHTAWQELLQSRGLESDKLNEEQVRIADQMVYRFGRLQDAIGTRLLPALLQIMQEWQDNEAWIDKINRAEKLGLLPSAEIWMLLRELRNQTAHEYPLQPEIVQLNLRRLAQHIPDLEAVLAQLQAHALRRGASMALGAWPRNRSASSKARRRPSWSRACRSRCWPRACMAIKKGEMRIRWSSRPEPCSVELDGQLDGPDLTCGGIELRTVAEADGQGVGAAAQQGVEQCTCRDVHESSPIQQCDQVQGVECGGMRGFGDREQGQGLGRNVQTCGDVEHALRTDLD